MKFSGLREIDSQLEKLSSKRGTAVLRAAMRAAAKPIAEQARANASAISEGSGALALSIAVQSFRVDEKNAVLLFEALPSMGRRFVISVGPKRKDATAIALYNLFYHRKSRRSGIYHGQFIEFAHRSRSGSIVTAQPILLPALQSRQSEALAIFAEKMRTGIAREVRKQK